MEQVPYVDFEQAARTGRQAVHPGPELSPGHIAEVVDALRAAATKAPVHVAEVSGMGTPSDALTLVVDRAGWIRAMARSAESILAGLGGRTTPSNPVDRVRGRTIGVQAGAVFAAMAPRILGQFDPFVQPRRLLLVAPNVVSVERQLGVNPTDFRLWICLHEQTHQAQFGYAPWLPGHLVGMMRELLEVGELQDTITAVTGAAAALGVGGPKERPDATGDRQRSVADLVIDPEQRATFDQMTAIMSLLEGHADVMMDRAGTPLLPTLPVIRRAFEGHRDRGGWSALLGKLLGMDLKRDQYRDGAAFCNAVLDKAGLDVLNLAFSQPSMLPTLAEIHDPQQWLARVAR
ncbi:MAG: zinc-dependent metalloprotease [Propionicimonas sp.]|nr:zinc-dependent metalloprotease [Propionicimonas sp.]